MGKYIKVFKTLEDANYAGEEGLLSPHVDIVKELNAVNIKVANVIGGSFTCEFDNSGHISNVMPYYKLEINTDGKGIVYGEGTYASGSVVTVKTFPNFGYEFSQWSDGDTNATRQITLSGNVSLSVVYTERASQANTEILYLPSDGNVINPYNIGAAYFGANMVSNTVSNNLGVITFDGPVTMIGNYAFYNRSTLMGISIPNSVTSIGEDAFSSCSSLTGITIPDSVTSIGSYAFRYCYSLTGITIPDSVTSIGNCTFQYSSGMTKCSIGSGVTSIGNLAFYYCTSLKSVICNPTTPPTLGTEVFNGNASGRKIYVPSESLETYKTATNWSDYANDMYNLGWKINGTYTYEGYTIGEGYPNIDIIDYTNFISNVQLTENTLILVTMDDEDWVCYIAERTDKYVLAMYYGCQMSLLYSLEDHKVYMMMPCPPDLQKGDLYGELTDAELISVIRDELMPQILYIHGYDETAIESAVLNHVYVPTTAEVSTMYARYRENLVTHGMPDEQLENFDEFVTEIIEGYYEEDWMSFIYFIHLNVTVNGEIIEVNYMPNV